MKRMSQAVGCALALVFAAGAGTGSGQESQYLSKGEKAALMKLARQALVARFRKGAKPPKLNDTYSRLYRLKNRVFVTIRRDGFCRGCYASWGRSLPENVVRAVDYTCTDTRYGGPLKAEELPRTRLELFILLKRVEFTDRSLKSILWNYNYGVESLEIRHSKDSRKRATFLNYVPIAYDYSTYTSLDRLCVKAGFVTVKEASNRKYRQRGSLAASVLKDRNVRLYHTPTIHLLESYDPDHPIELYRCNVFVPAESINRERVVQAILLAGDWIRNMVRWNGRMEYRYYPVSDSHSRSNNMVRAWMGTVALGDLYAFTGDERYKEAATRNLAYNFRTFYRERPKENFGYIYYSGMGKLGAAAHATTALIKIDREKKYAHQLEMLRNFLLTRQKPDGSFNVVYPESSMDPELRRLNVRYYSGEALLALMYCYRQSKDERLLDAVRKAFPFFRAYFRKDGHPASVPWLTQAYYEAYLADRKEEYKDFIFEMNDFLISMQNQSGAPEPDYLGRFYDPRRPQFGPPLSASTGVYVEGLVDAYRLARLVGDDDREANYRKSIILGIRSLVQLQYREDNVFFLPRPDRALGGIRSRVDGTWIRIDYTQHAVQGMIKAVQALKEWTIH